MTIRGSPGVVVVVNATGPQQRAGCSFRRGRNWTRQTCWFSTPRMATTSHRTTSGTSSVPQQAAGWWHCTTAFCGTNAAWFKTVAGGAKVHGETNWSRGLTGLSGLSASDYGGRGNFDPGRDVLAATHARRKVLGTHSRQKIIRRCGLRTGQGTRVRCANFLPTSLPHYRGLLLQHRLAGSVPWILVRQEELASFRIQPAGQLHPEAARKSGCRRSLFESRRRRTARRSRSRWTGMRAGGCGWR